MIASSARNGAFIDNGYAKNHDLDGRLAAHPADAERRRRSDARGRGIFEPPAGGSPFGPVTISTATFDKHLHDPKNIFTFVDDAGRRDRGQHGGARAER